MADYKQTARDYLENWRSTQETVSKLQAENAALVRKLDYWEAHPATVQRRLRKTEAERDALIEAARKFVDALDKYVDDDCTKPLNLLHTQGKVRELLPPLPTTPIEQESKQ